ncbi:MAG TPA: DUF4870 domain-containing protein [Opitutaceae bacterium]|jgi:hypothetical protein
MTTATYSSNDRLWSVLCHLSFFFGVGVLAFVLPLVLYLVMKRDSPFITHHAREALNFHLSLLLYGIICIPLCIIVIGAIGYVVIGLIGLICAIVAAVRASQGVYYEYPMTIRFVRQ